MKFNPKNLKSFFNFIRKSPIDDMAVNAVKNNADDIAMGALNAVDDVGKLYGESMLTPKNEAFIDALDDALFKSSDTSKLRNFTPLKELRPVPLKEYKVNYSPLEKYFSTLKGTSNADNLANSALDTVDDIPTSISFDDIADTYTWRQTHDINKPPITPAEFKKQFGAEQSARRETRELLKLFPEQYTPEQYTTVSDFSDIPLPEEPLRMDSAPDYDAMKINPIAYGQIPQAVDSLEYPDGFTDPDQFARYYTDLEQGFSTNNNMLPEYTQNDFDRDVLNDFRSLRIPGEDTATTIRKFFKKYGYYPY